MLSLATSPSQVLNDDAKVRQNMVSTKHFTTLFAYTALNLDLGQRNTEISIF